MFIHRLFGVLATVLLALIVAAPHTSVAAPNPPTPVDETPFTVEGLCAFPVQLELNGKSKTITLPGGRSIITSPGLDVTLTNMENTTNHTTLNITGASHISVLANGDVQTLVTGRNLLFDPVAGFVLSQGRFSFVFDASGNLIQPLSGTGQLTDVCALLN